MDNTHLLKDTLLVYTIRTKRIRYSFKALAYSTQTFNKNSGIDIFNGNHQLV